jgi:hypothetical protein
MHRLVMGLSDGQSGQSLQGMVVDHINHNGLDNQKHNLRVCTQGQNRCNSRIYKNNRSGFKGVSFFAPTGKWLSRISVNKKTYHLGLFDTPEDAYVTYCENAKKYHGNFTNVI